MTWDKFKELVKPEIEKVYNKGRETETLIFKNGRGISRYELKRKQNEFLALLKL